MNGNNLWECEQEQKILIQQNNPSITWPSAPATPPLSPAPFLAAAAATARSYTRLGRRRFGSELFNTVGAAGGESVGKEGLVQVPVIVAVG
jgi:hypothetical protein